MTTDADTASAGIPHPRAAPRVESAPPAPGAGSGEPAGLTGHAWLLRDVTHVPGVLSLRRGRLRFVSTRRVVFDATPAELGLVGGRSSRSPFRLTVDGEQVGLSVTRPAGAVPVPAALADVECGPDATRGEPTDADRWRTLLAPQTASMVRRALHRALLAAPGTTRRREATPA